MPSQAPQGELVEPTVARSCTGAISSTRVRRRVSGWPKPLGEQEGARVCVRQRRPCRLLYGQPLVPRECPYVRASGPSLRVRVTRGGRGGRTGRRVRRHAHREVSR